MKGPSVITPSVMSRVMLAVEKFTDMVCRVQDLKKISCYVTKYMENEMYDSSSHCKGMS
jgi:hypothetical protein